MDHILIKEVDYKLNSNIKKEHGLHSNQEVDYDLHS